MGLARDFKRDYDAYLEQRDDTLAAAALGNLEHQVVLARQEGGAFVSDCHDGITVATFMLANLWLLRAHAPELTWAQLQASEQRIDRETKSKIIAAMDAGLGELDRSDRKKRAAPTSTPRPFPTAIPSASPTPTAEEAARQPQVVAFLKEERMWLLAAYERGADHYWKKAYAQAKADVIDDYTDRDTVFVPYERMVIQSRP